MGIINRIVHLADIHIRSNVDRHEEYKKVFEKLYKKVNENKPDRIVIVGDLFHDYINISNEAKVLASEFLTNLAEVSKVIITRGNHDLAIKFKNRVDSIQALTDIMNNKNIIYYSKSGFYIDENVCWVVHSHGEKINPWIKMVDSKPNGEYKFIDLFHDPVYGATNEYGYEFTNKKLNKPSDFEGDYSLFGDIHKRSFF